MRILSTIILVLVLVMLDTRQDLSLGRAVAPELIGNDYPRYILQSLQKLAKELLRCFLVSATLHEDIQDIAVLVHCSPQVMNTAIDLEKHFI
jgi:hypothetical protein